MDCAALKSRLERLERMRSSGSYANALERVDQLLGDDRPSALAIAPSFVLEDKVWGESTLTRIKAPHGSNAAFALLCLGAAQSGRLRQGRLLLPITPARKASLPAWSTLVAESKDEPLTVAGESAEEKRAKSARSALAALERGQFISLPKAGTADRFSRVKLLGEPLLSGTPTSYYLPEHEEHPFDVPISFLTSGWIYALNHIEISLYLALRHRRSATQSQAFSFDHTPYALSRRSRQQYKLLVAAGLLTVERDPRRASSGQWRGYEPGQMENTPQPDSYTLTDVGLEQDSLTTVLTALREQMEAGC